MAKKAFTDFSADKRLNRSCPLINNYFCNQLSLSLSESNLLCFYERSDQVHPYLPLYKQRITGAFRAIGCIKFQEQTTLETDREQNTYYAYDTRK